MMMMLKCKFILLIASLVMMSIHAHPVGLHKPPDHVADNEEPPDAIVEQVEQLDWNVPDARHLDALPVPEVQRGAPNELQDDSDFRPVDVESDGLLHGQAHDENVINMHQQRAVEQEALGGILDNNIEKPDTIDNPNAPHEADDVILPDPRDTPDNPSDNIVLPTIRVPMPKNQGSVKISNALDLPDIGNVIVKESDNVNVPEILDGEEDTIPEETKHDDTLVVPDVGIREPIQSDDIELPGGDDGVKDDPDAPHNDNLPIPDEDGDFGAPDGEMLHRKPGQAAAKVILRSVGGHDIGLNDIDEMKQIETDDHDNQMRVQGNVPEQIVKGTIIPALSITELKPPDHLNGVHLEADGHLNRDYHKEMFFGGHEDIHPEDEEETNSLLKDIFHRVDTNLNGFMDQRELTEWIQLKVDEHFVDASADNKHIFKALDRDRDGFITWREFHVEYLIAQGNDKGNSEKHADDYDTLDLDIEEKDQLIRYKYRWADADEEPQDNSITLEEFKYFRHPEQSPKTLQRMVNDIMDSIDVNPRDGELTIDEFAAVPEDEEDEDWRTVDKVWTEERRKEFRTIIDHNHDGKVSLEELTRYVDPRNPNNAAMEARNLIDLADENDDHKLSLSEVLENADVFTASKMVNAVRIFHDEF